MVDLKTVFPPLPVSLGVHGHPDMLRLSAISVWDVASTIPNHTNAGRAKARLESNPVELGKCSLSARNDCANVLRIREVEETGRYSLLTPDMLGDGVGCRNQISAKVSNRVKSSTVEIRRQCGLRVNHRKGSMEVRNSEN